MSFTRVKPSGYSAGSEVLSAELNQLDIDHAKAVDKTGDTITGAIICSGSSSFTTQAGCTLTIGGNTIVTAAITTNNIVTFSSGATCDIATGATCSFESGAVCHFASGSTITGAATVASGASVTFAEGSTLTISATTTTFNRQTLIANGALLNVQSGGVFNVDDGGFATFTSASTVEFAGTTLELATFTLSGAGQIAHKWRVATGTAYTFDNGGALTDEIVLVQNNSGSPYNVTLPLASSLSGREIRISDALFNAGTHNIVLICQGADNFGRFTGVTVQSIGTNGAAMRLVSDGLSGWYYA